MKILFFSGGRACGWLKNPAIYAAAAVLCILLESIPAFDRLFQTPFFHDGSWLLSKAFHAAWKPVLYTGPKIIIGIIGGGFFLFWAAMFFRREKSAFLSSWRKPALLVALSLAIVPASVAALKAISGVYGPIDLLPYGGKFPHTGLLEQLWLYGHPGGGRSFPAGHASGGFALCALYYLPVSKVCKKMLFTSGLAAGWLMGLYQMGRGEHFLSHTLTTMFIALAAITWLARRLRLS